MKINLDYEQPPIPEGSKEIQMSHQALTWDYLFFAIKTKYPQLAHGPAMQTLASIQRKFDVALNPNNLADAVDLTEEELAFLRVCVEDCAYPVFLSKFVVLLIDELFTNAPKKENQPAGNQPATA
jgi:hypothetical protein